MQYGVLVDLQRPRQGWRGTLPVGRGWYAERTDALEALRLVEKRYPHVRAYLVEFPHTPLRRALPLLLWRGGWVTPNR